MATFGDLTCFFQGLWAMALCRRDGRKRELFPFSYWRLFVSYKPFRADGGSGLYAPSDAVLLALRTAAGRHTNNSKVGSDAIYVR